MEWQGRGAGILYNAEGRRAEQRDSDVDGWMEDDGGGTGMEDDGGGSTSSADADPTQESKTDWRGRGVMNCRA